jgi:hypothetical protein
MIWSERAMRHLLLHHPRFILGVAFFGTMIVIGKFIAPYVVHNFGVAGAVITVAAIFGVAVLMERRGY